MTTLSFFSKEIVKYISRALLEKRLLYFGMANLDFKFSDPVYTVLEFFLSLTSHILFLFLKLVKKGLTLCPHQDLWTPEDVVPESLRETWR